MTLFGLVSIFISLVTVASFINYIRLRTTIEVMLVGSIELLALILIGPHTGGFREPVAFMMSQIDFNQTVLHGMLGFLLFAGAIHIKLDELARRSPSSPCWQFSKPGLHLHYRRIDLAGTWRDRPEHPVHARHAVWRPGLADRSHCRHGHHEIRRSPPSSLKSRSPGNRCSTMASE